MGPYSRLFKCLNHYVRHYLKLFFDSLSAKMLYDNSSKTDAVLERRCSLVETNRLEIQFSANFSLLIWLSIYQK